MPTSPRELSTRAKLLAGIFYVLYNQFAWLYDTVAYTVSNGKWQSWLLTILQDINGPKVLEIGHGPGHLLLALEKRGISITGIDSSRQMTRIAYQRIQSNGVSPSIVHGLAQSLPFPDETFHEIVSTFPSNYIFEDVTLREINRVLLPDGKLIVIPVAWITGRHWLDRLAAWIFLVTGQSASNTETVKKLFEESGFVVQTYRRNVPSSEVLILSMEKWKS